jgi:transcriptional regulator with XRE-family HTH domain
MALTKTARRFLSAVITYEKAAEIRKLAKAYPDLTRKALAERFGCTPQTISNLLNNPDYRVDPRGDRRPKVPTPQTLASMAREVVEAQRKKEKRLEAARERALREQQRQRKYHEEHGE